MAKAVVLLILSLLTASIASAQTNYTILKSFGFPDQPGAGSDGVAPNSLFEASDGRLYGTTDLGGDADGGIVFGINRDGTGYAILHEFASTESSPEIPYDLIESTDGVLYGITRGGGSFHVGSIFRMQKDGSDYVVLFDFQRPIGSAPWCILEGTDGALYGNTLFGGALNRGTVFRIEKDGTGHTVLHTFGEGTDTLYPAPGLFESSDGWLYGASENMGSAGAGLIFKLKKDGTGYTEVYGFPELGSHNGPTTLPIEGFDGALYGATLGGGVADAGVVFKVNKDGTGFVRLFDFPSRGSFVSQNVTLASDGVLYGTTYTSGSADQGTLFKLNRDGSRYAVLHNFTNSAGDGALPWSLPFEGSDGALYGTTAWGGALGHGTIFRYVPSPEITSVQPHPAGNVHVTARALRGNNVAIQASTNLSSWTDIASGPVTNGHFTTTDSQSSHRFYRARLHQ